jgi:hypothetical protein
MMQQPDQDPEAPTRRIRRKLLLGFAALAAVALSTTSYLGALASSEANGEASGTRTSGESVSASETRTPRASDAPAAPDPSPDPASPETPGLSNKPDVPTPLPPEQAKIAAKKFLDASVTVDPAAPDSNAGLGDAASGAILAEVENDAQELEANGWTRQGSATIEALTIVSSDSSTDPATVVAQACVDSSKVMTLDYDGKPVGTSGSAGQRALNIYTLQDIAGTWKVVARTFPDNPTC